jgi:hypothetical protein
MFFITRATNHIAKERRLAEAAVDDLLYVLFVIWN